MDYKKIESKWQEIWDKNKDEERRRNPVDFEDYFAVIKGPNSAERSERAGRLENYCMAQLYLNVLVAKYAKSSLVDLREMLSIKGDASTSEYASQYLHDFMLEQGFDGVIYIEGGDHPEHVKPVSLVFFNLEKLGTFETWNNET